MVRIVFEHTDMGLTLLSDRAVAHLYISPRRLHA